MGQLGFQEIIVIFVIALLVFGPRKLPELGKSLGKGLREFRKATNDLKSSWEEQVRDIDKDVKETRRDFSKIGRDVQNTIHDDKANKRDRRDAAPADGQNVEATKTAETETEKASGEPSQSTTRPAEPDTSSSTSESSSAEATRPDPTEASTPPNSSTRETASADKPSAEQPSPSAEQPPSEKPAEKTS